MLQPNLITLHPQPRLPLTPKHIIWGVIIAVLVMLLLSLASSDIAHNYRVSSGSTYTSVDATTVRLYFADPGQREQAIMTLG